MGKRGPKTKFSAQITAQLLEQYSKGKTDAEVCKIVGISERSLNYWKAKHPELLQSIKYTKNMIDDVVVASLFASATGMLAYGRYFPPNFYAQRFWLMNRQPDKWRPENQIAPPETPPEKLVSEKKKTFAEFCADAGYPLPLEKQIEMMNFGLYESGARMLLGSRGYGKTDYITILGNAYLIYCDWFDNKERPEFSVFIITKSKERNTAIINEIAKALKANGVPLEKENSTQVKVKGQHGKDASASVSTIKGASYRGRHPKLIVMDDPVTEDDTSEATRKLVKKKYNEGFKLCSNILIIGQPAHEHDLYAELRPLVNKMEVPHGSIPELDHDLEAQRLAGVDEKSIQASYFLKIVSDGSNPFDGVKYMDKFPSQGSAVAFIDPSHEGGDTTALTILKQHMQGIVVVGFVWKKAWHHCTDQQYEKLKKYGVAKVAFETNGLGQQPLEILGQVFKGIGVVGRRSNNNKHSRIMAAGAYAHLIHLCQESDKGYIDQVRYYEYNAKVDDAPDSLATCLEWIGLIRGKM